MAPRKMDSVVPPLSEFPSPTAARTRMAVPAYEIMFGKLQLRSLFDDYFHQPGSVNAGIILKTPEDPTVQLSAAMSPAGGEAMFRWQRDLDNPNTYVDLLASTAKPMLQVKSCAYYPKYGIGAFGTFPLLMANRGQGKEDYGIMGVRYGSKNLSVGASFLPFAVSGEVPYGAWLVTRKGRLSAGVHYKPLGPAGESENTAPFNDLKNWNCAISYGTGSTSLLSPSYIFALELLRSTQLVASFYRRHVIDTKEINKGVPFFGTKGYVDFGLELNRSLEKDKPAENEADDSLFQVAASWQPNSSLLVKGKVGSSKSSAALVCNSWWKPFLTFSATVENDHQQGTRSYGVGFRVEDI
ncbi:unnamed protein product [Triticum turgidum subsp. durum]|uniref:Porin n=1 Tax=Triticum turgidum subsp. durum TaxID=4567 RepID=A0A9R0R6P4_TRITD|nr:unnamed protein product [Triticum turgidum subsp. durum]